MDHKDTDNDTHNSIAKSDKNISETSNHHSESLIDYQNETPQESQEKISQDDFFVSHKSKNIVQSGSVLILILIIAFSFIVGILIFGYIYNLAGIRSFISKYDESQKKLQFISVKIPEKLSDNPISVDTLNASKQVQKLQILSNTQENLDDDTSLASNETNNNITSKNLNDNNDTALFTFDSLNTENTDTKREYYQRIDTLKHEFKSVSRQFLVLNEKFARGYPYLDVLIDLKTLLRNQKIDTPVLTEYASGGFPTDMIIATDAIKLIKKLALIESRQNSSGTFMSVINRFIVITPQSDSAGLSGILHKIDKALDDGDFDTVYRLIHQLSPQKQKSFKELKILISDKKAVHGELKELNDAIIETIFKLPQ